MNTQLFVMLSWCAERKSFHWANKLSMASVKNRRSEWKKRKREGGGCWVDCGACAAGKMGNSLQKLACCTPTPTALQAAHLQQGGYYRQVCFFCLVFFLPPCQFFFFSPLFTPHSRAVLVWESAENWAEEKVCLCIMGALMVIFSLQPKQRAKTKGNHLWLIFHSLVAQQIAWKGFHFAEGEIIQNCCTLVWLCVKTQRILLEVTLYCWVDVVAAAVDEIKPFVCQLNGSAGAPLTFRPPRSLSILQLTHAARRRDLMPSHSRTLTLYFCPTAVIAACCCHIMTRAACHLCQTTIKTSFLSDGQIYAQRVGTDGTWR